MSVDEVTGLERKNERLERAVKELRVLNDLALAIGGFSEVDEILQTITRKSIEAIPSEQGTITLIDEKEQASGNTLIREMASTAGDTDFHFSQALLGWMLLNKKPLIVNDPGDDERFRAIELDPEIRSLVSAPLMIKSELIGMLTLFNDRTGGGFGEEDQRLLSILGAESAQIIENARLQEERKALRDQVRLAAEVQRHLLPETLPQCEGYEFSGTSEAALVVGGDYYDFIAMEDHRCAICLGDVSGKGLPAALLMANVQATIRLLANLDLSPRDAMDQANNLLVRSTPHEKFVTFFYSILDPGRNELRFCNAGHNPPILVRDGEVERLRTRGIVLGVLEKFVYEEATETFEPGDLVLIFSDGVTEALSEDEIEFGDDRLVELLVEHRNEPVESIREVIMKSVHEHAGDRAQSDDITLAILKRQPQAR